MIHQIKAQLTASLKKIDRQNDIERLCSFLSVSLSMASALDDVENLDNSESFYLKLYNRVASEIDDVNSMIKNYEKEEDIPCIPNEPQMCCDGCE